MGYQVYLILLFPLAFYLLWKNYINAAFYFSAIFIFLNNDLFESVIDLVFNSIPFWTSGLFRFVIPLLLVSIFGTFLLRRSLQRNSYWWYWRFIIFMIGFYLVVNDRNSRIEFISDVGFRKYDLILWFNNCGTYYAWWAAPILLNTGLFCQIQNSKDGS